MARLVLVALVGLVAAVGAGYIVGASGGDDCEAVTSRYVGHCIALRVEVETLVDQLGYDGDSPTWLALRQAAHHRTASISPWLARCSAQPDAIKRLFSDPLALSGDRKHAAEALRRALDYVPRDRQGDWTFLRRPETGQ